MTVLVTGGAGYIGSHACKALAKAGFTPVTYDNLSTGHLDAVKWGPFICADIADKKALSNAIKRHNPIAVLHFAANAIVIESIQNPAKYYRNNMAGTLNLLETMCEHDLKNLIFSSSCATYGNALTLPMSEEHPQNPTSPYGRSKLMAEQMMADFDKAYGLKTILLRYFNAAGADLDGELGETHLPETHLIPSIIQSNRANIYGDGSAIRDYVHVADLAQAHVLALQYLIEKKKSDVFNLGTGQGISVLEIVEAIEKHSGKPVPKMIHPAREGEPTQLTANPIKAKTILGWVPKHSQLNTLIETAYKWSFQ